VGSVFATPTPEEMAYVRQTAETIPGPSTSNLVAKANELNLFVAFGMTETDEADTLYNTSVFLGPQGVFGKHRKYHLWGDDGTGGNEPLIWQRGPDEPAVVASPLGKVGLIICVEMGYYEGPVLANVQLNQGGQYRLHITNAASPNWTAVSATFNLTVLADGDADGLADVWETECGLNPASANHGTADDDDDGLTNGQEYTAGTDPTNALSYLKVDSITPAEGGSAAMLGFWAVSNKTYTVQYRDSLEIGDWSRLVDVVAVSSNRLVEISDPGPVTAARRSYRLVTPRTP
jgi:predicted amidohydrolase